MIYNRVDADGHLIARAVVMPDQKVPERFCRVAVFRFDKNVPYQVREMVPEEVAFSVAQKGLHLHPEFWSGK